MSAVNTLETVTVGTIRQMTYEPEEGKLEEPSDKSADNSAKQESPLTNVRLAWLKQMHEKDFDCRNCVNNKVRIVSANTCISASKKV